ncbi:MAG: ribonuclease HII [Bacteroidia bacterium]|nr:ribonuclease HII [Bacteroidia bacterium]
MALVKNKLLNFLLPNVIEAGCDEAGRGCLAGPVVAAAVILPPHFYHPLLNDSKQLTHKQRNELRPIIEKEAIAYAVGFVDNVEIDHINILNASILAMHKALAIVAKKHKLAHIIVDGNRFKPFNNTPHTTIIKGDGKYASIAAASVLAKTYRDDYMANLHAQHPLYTWDKNQGYPTKAHRAGIALHGTTPYHRLTFRLLAVE